MTRTAYLNLIGGASGDMLLAALLDAGLPVESLRAELAKLPASGFALRPANAQRGGVHGTHLRVELGEGAGEKLTWRDFRGMVRESALDSPVKDKALAVFRNLAEAERLAHKDEADNLDAELCELGSLDTLVDVVGVVAGLRLLGVERVSSSALPSGAGVIRSAHGPLPAMGPATSRLAAMAHAAVVTPGDVRGEMVTPTGAALVTTLADFRRPTLRLERVGYGLGTKDLPDHPNVLALWIGEENADALEAPARAITLLETNIDDMSPQVFGYVQERLMAMGALDVWFSPIQMKKNRPATLLSVMLPAALEARVVEFLFKETSTLGVRTRPIVRHEAPRESITVETAHGPVSVKVKRWNGRPVAAAPEYEDCRAIAERTGVPLQEVMEAARRAAWGQIGKGER
ncbi:MAG: nickel pincer cofactor biosynthesis protein LarC [SAR202 cluster bacterium]|nr:nickel pincer cofactor biosynthesis protein LarC [SAR202 cluster bacterium]